MSLVGRDVRSRSEAEATFNGSYSSVQDGDKLGHWLVVVAE